MYFVHLFDLRSVDESTVAANAQTTADGAVTTANGAATRMPEVLVLKQASHTNFNLIGVVCT